METATNKMTISQALLQLDKLDEQWVRGSITEGEREGQRLVVLINLLNAQA
jgi:hypothetical protein